MSESSETSGRPLAPVASQSSPQHQGNTSLHHHHHQHSVKTTITTHQSIKPSPPSSHSSSNERCQASTSTDPRRHPATARHLSTSPQTGSSRSEQHPASPTNAMSQLSSVHYTRTGRISKAKKGLKVHNCENCGRAYTRAEHLRRHQKNHAQDDAILCEFPECGKVFYRLDLLHRHQERHNEPEKEPRQPSVFSQETTPDPPQASHPALMSSGSSSTILPTTPAYYTPQPASPMREPAALPSNAKRNGSYSARHSTAVPVSIDAMSSNLGWNEPFSQSPSYSSSSGYASPNPGPGDYANMFASAPYGPSRTRTSSNASFVEPWSYPSRSPTSVASTLAYTWSANDKPSAAPGLAYMGTAYPLTSIPMPTSIDLMTGYGHFGAKSMMQRDEEEGVILFGDQAYGMGPIAHNYPFEHYLDYFWRLFHPAFPVVHRSTFESMMQPPILQAAMIAVGGQYSTDSTIRRESRLLHDRCVKLLERREQEQHLMAEPDRLSDYQAMFLVEAHCQYRARRAAKTLSSHFEKVFRKSADNFRHTASKLADMALHMVSDDAATRWAEWVELATWQRLLLSCYILESEQTLVLAREPVASLFQETGFDLPFPAHCSLWEAASSSDWTTAAQEAPYSAKYVFEVTAESNQTPLDAFQSSLLLAVHSIGFMRMPYASCSSSLDVESWLDTSRATRRKLLTGKLVQVTPIRALLAVAGESWILSEKVASAQKFSSLKATLRAWVAPLWAVREDEHHGVAAREALTLSILLLQEAFAEGPDSSTIWTGTDMGIYFAGLVLWAVATAASTQASQLHHPKTHQSLGHQSQAARMLSPIPLTSTPSTPTDLRGHVTRRASVAPPTSQSTILGRFQGPSDTAVSKASTEYMAMLSHDQITANASDFLSAVLVDLGLITSSLQLPGGLARCRTGCMSLLVWIKMRLSGEDHLHADTAADGWPGGRSEGLGELMDSILGCLERIVSRGWHGWGVWSKA